MRRFGDQDYVICRRGSGRENTQTTSPPTIFTCFAALQFLFSNKPSTFLKLPNHENRMREVKVESRRATKVCVLCFSKCQSDMKRLIAMEFHTIFIFLYFLYAYGNRKHGGKHMQCHSPFWLTDKASNCLYYYLFLMGN